MSLSFDIFRQRKPESTNGEVIYEPRLVEPLESTLEKIANITRGEPETYGATPLDQLATMAQQDELLTKLIAYTYSVPDGVSLQIADYVHTTFRERFVNRANANNENYMRSLLTKDAYEATPQVVDMVSRAETGHASAAELLLVRQLLGIRSVELACLTHPYGERIKPGESLLDEMRDVVGISILELGGTLNEAPTPHYRVKEVILGDVPPEEWSNVYTQSNIQRLKNGEQHGGVTGLLMTRKREIGTMPDGTIIKERSSFVLRTDCDNPTAHVALEALKYIDDTHEWQDDAVLAGSLDTVASNLLENNQFSLAIPVASTIYAHNPETAKLVKQKYGDSGSRAQTLVFSDAVKRELNDTHFVEQYGDMFFIGHEGPQDPDAPAVDESQR